VIGRIRSFITTGFRGAVNSVRSAMSRFRSAVSTGISNVLGYVRRIPGRITSALGSMGNLLKRAGRAVIDGFLGGLTGAFGKVQDFVGGIGSWIVNNKGPISYDKVMLKPAGTAIMAGLIGSMRAAFPDLQRMVGDVNATLLDAGQVRPRLSLSTSGGAPRTEVHQDNRKIEVRAGVGDAIAIGREVEKYSRRYDGARGTKK
jgi:phage-related protein